MAVARMRRWSEIIGSPSADSGRRLAACGRCRARLRARGPPRRGVRNAQACAPRSRAGRRGRRRAARATSRAAAFFPPASAQATQGRGDGLVDEVGAALAMVLPGKMAMPVAPDGVEGGDVCAFGRQAEIADRDQARAGGRIAELGLRQFAAEIAERVELLDIAGLEAGLRAHPVAQAEFEGAVALRVEPAVGQAGCAIGMACRKRVGRRLPSAATITADRPTAIGVVMPRPPKVDGIEKACASSETSLRGRSPRRPSSSGRCGRAGRRRGRPGADWARRWRGVADGPGDLFLVGPGIVDAGRDEGAGGRAGNAGPAVDQHGARRCPRPPRNG